MQQWFPACPLSFFLPSLSLLSLCSLLPSLFPLLFLCFMQSLINHMATATHRTSLRPIKCISSFHLSIYLPPTPLTRPPPLSAPHCTSVRLVRACCVLYVLQLAWQQRGRRRRLRWWRQCPTGFPIWSHISATCSHCVSINGGNNNNNYDILLMLSANSYCMSHLTAQTRPHTQSHTHILFGTHSIFHIFTFCQFSICALSCLQKEMKLKRKRQ